MCVVYRGIAYSFLRVGADNHALTRAKGGTRVKRLLLRNRPVGLEFLSGVCPRRVRHRLPSVKMIFEAKNAFAP